MLASHTMQADDIVLVAASRTPIGAFQGALRSLTAPQLGAHAIQGVLQQLATHSPANTFAANQHQLIDAVLMGCVLPAGQGQAPARQAALRAGLAQSTACTTINKMCGSGLQTIIFAHDILRAHSANVVLAGGMESMSNAPYLLPKARAGLRMGHAQLQDHMFLDGLEDAYQPGNLMGVFAEQCADHFQFSRAAQDAYALESVRRAQHASHAGLFAKEITPITLDGLAITLDEGPQTARPEKIPHLKPAFRAHTGTVTAANASSISDGAAAVLLMRYSTAQHHGLQPLARVVGHATHAQAPRWFTTAPIEAIQKLCNNLGWEQESIDLFEINEAFAVVAMAAIQALKLDPTKVNIHGGACVLGHPIGASGTRIVVTLLHALRQHNLRRGVAAICIGGGEASAIGVEIIY